MYCRLRNNQVALCLTLRSPLGSNFLERANIDSCVAFLLNSCAPTWSRRLQSISPITWTVTVLSHIGLQSFRFLDDSTQWRHVTFFLLCGLENLTTASVNKVVSGKLGKFQFWANCPFTLHYLSPIILAVTHETNLWVLYRKYSVLSLSVTSWYLNSAKIFSSAVHHWWVSGWVHHSFQSYRRVMAQQATEGFGPYQEFCTRP